MIKYSIWHSSNRFPIPRHDGYRDSTSCCGSCHYCWSWIPGLAPFLSRHPSAFVYPGVRSILVGPRSGSQHPNWASVRLPEAESQRSQSCSILVDEALTLSVDCPRPSGGHFAFCARFGLPVAGRSTSTRPAYPSHPRWQTTIHYSD